MKNENGDFSPDLAELRGQILAAEKWAYLDHAAVAPLPIPAKEVLQHWAADTALNGNTVWLDWDKRVESARRAAANLINAQLDEIALAVDEHRRRHFGGVSLGRIQRGIAESRRPGPFHSGRTGASRKRKHPVAQPGVAASARQTADRGGDLEKDSFRSHYRRIAGRRQRRDGSHCGGAVAGRDTCSAMHFGRNRRQRNLRRGYRHVDAQHPAALSTRTASRRWSYRPRGHRHGNSANLFHAGKMVIGLDAMHKPLIFFGCSRIIIRLAL